MMIVNNNNNNNNNNNKMTMIKIVILKIILILLFFNIIILVHYYYLICFIRFYHDNRLIFRQFYKRIKKMEHDALIKLSKDQSIVVVKSDKTNQVVILLLLLLLTEIDRLLSFTRKLRNIHFAWLFFIRTLLIILHERFVFLSACMLIMTIFSGVTLTV